MAQPHQDTFQTHLPLTSSLTANMTKVLSEYYDLCCHLHPEHKCLLPPVVVHVFMDNSDVVWTCHAGSCHGSSLVVMSKGTRYTQQSYKVSDAFPFEWIKKKWKENFYITSMATAGVHPRPLVSCGSLLCLHICIHIRCSCHKPTSCSLWVRAYFVETCCCKQAVHAA